LPERSPRVASWHVQWLEKKEEFLGYQKQLIVWLKEKGFHPKERGEFLSHVTVARQPFEVRDWKEAFEKLPLFSSNLHLCESLGNSRYEVCWTHPAVAPFEEIEHTADLAFVIRGANFSEIFLHAELALSFHFPPLIRYFSTPEIKSEEEVVRELNRLVALADEKEGTPFKAVSYSGVFKKEQFLEWEMIVDV
jgi:hypothetical protein